MLYNVTCFIFYMTYIVRHKLPVLLLGHLDMVTFLSEYHVLTEEKTGICKKINNSVCKYVRNIQYKKCVIVLLIYLFLSKLNIHWKG